MVKLFIVRRMIDENWRKHLSVRNVKIGESTFITVPVKPEPENIHYLSIL